MAKLIRTKTEWEGINHEELAIIEGESPPPWPPGKQFETIGREVPAVDSAERVTGQALYTSDIQLPGMLHARILRSPYPHARIKRMETDRAASLPGVRAIISHLNVPAISWLNQSTILEPIVRFQGDEVAAVAADDEETANDALDLIDVEYENLPFVIDAEKALQVGAPRIYAQGNLVKGKPRIYVRGDTRRGFREADVIVEETFRTQTALHNCLEPHGAVASWDSQGLTVWESTQSIYRVQEDLAEAFQIPPNQIRVICQYMGGGFGSKQYSGKWAILAALLSRQTGRPVRLMLDRQEENLAAGNRSPTVQHLKIGARRDGTLTAIELSSVASIGAYGWSVLAVEGPVQVMYACPNIRTEVRSVYTNTGPSRSFRGPGYVEGAFPLESLMDELADELQMDPLELRLKNYARFDQTTGLDYSAKHLDQCYRKGAEMIGWNSGRRTAQDRGGRKVGLGMASQVWGGGGGPPAYAWVRVNKDGTVEVITGSQDIGTGVKTVFAQIAAEEFGLRPEQIIVHLGDTAKGPYDPVSWGSMTVSSVGPAIRQAAIDARNQLCGIAAEYLGLPAGDVNLRGGSIYIKGRSQQHMTISEIAEEIGEFTILGKGSREPNRTDIDVRTFGAQFAEVEVDTSTGEVLVSRVVTVHDIGRVINPLGGRNQVEGAVVQGIGYALTEGRVIDERSGVVLNVNLEDYQVPTALDFGDIDQAFINQPDNRSNNLGAKGLGEPAMIPTSPAIANAIARATGIRFLSIPITRDKIIEGLQLPAGARRVVP